MADPSYKVRLARKTPEPARVRECVDEVFAREVHSVHFEDMGDHFWGRVYFQNGGSLTLSFTAKGRRVSLMVEDDKTGKCWRDGNVADA